jgi:hypothetical protein
MTTLLILTAGQTDVQLVADNQRHKLDGNACGTLHDAIKERSWSIVDAPSIRSRVIIKTLPESELELCTPKLDAVLTYFGDTPPSSAIIFETNREDSRDPRMSGQVMEHRLRDRGVKHVTRVAFLTEKQQLEDPSNDLDAVVRRSVVCTLSDAIGRGVHRLTKDDRVFVAATGGLPAANEAINELIRLNAVGGPTVIALEVPDGDRVNQGDHAVEEKFHPAAGYRARWHALALVEKGNLLGAWGAVSHLEGEPGQDWTQVIKWLASFASSQPLPPDCELAVLGHPHMALRAALRVELALRAGNIPRAVHGTVAFFEAAFWDHLRKYDFAAEGITTCGDKEYRLPDAGSADLRKRFRKRKSDNGTWRIDDFEQGICAWLPVLNRSSLSRFWSALSDEIRSLRHDVAHNEPTTALMNDARRRMQVAALWSSTDTFLSQKLVQGVLGELGEPEPSKLLESLLAEVRRRLVVITTSRQS